MILRDIIGAFSFLTTLPVGNRGRFVPLRMVQFFPLVGLVLGMIVALLDRFFLFLWPPYLSSLLDVLFLVILSGALHLDGLADSADGLFSHRSRKQALEIMKDSRVGAMGVVSLIFVLACKWSALSCLVDSRGYVLLLVPAYSRSAVLWAVRYLDYGRENGTGAAFFKTQPGWSSFWPFLCLVPASFVLGCQAAITLNLSYCAVVVLLLSWYKRKLGGVTGDTLGAMIEIQEAVLLLVMAMGR